MSYQSITILGNLGKDPEVRFGKDSKAICKFSVAVSDKGRDEHVEWFSVTCFDKLAENCGQYLQKGRQALIVGRLKTSEYEKDGEKKRFTELIASQVQFVGTGETGGGGKSAPPAAKGAAPKGKDAAPDLEDLPF